MPSADSSTPSDGDSIKVFVRVRPPDQAKETASDACLEVDNAHNAIRLHAKPEPKVFTYDQVADMYTTQETVFTSVGKRIIESCIDGYNGTIFAYGQTGSGKTFTMLGPSEDAENFQHELRGVIPRTFEYLFKQISRQQEMNGDKVQFLCRCSFLEIYKEQIFDLLDPSANNLHIRENIKSGVFVDGLTEQAVINASEAYQVLSAGWDNRTVASTAMNRESSRSHAVFTVTIESKFMKEGVQNVKTSLLNLVDLAGSERQKDTHTAGIRLKEASSINKSLSVLGNVIMALVDIAHGKKRHVPYRNSKLSFLLRDSLGGNAKTYIIACVHPGSRCFGETLSTLQFASRAKMIKNKAIVNEDTHGNVASLQAEIKRLKEIVVQYHNSLRIKQPGATGAIVSPNIEDLKSTDEPISVLKNFYYAMLFLQKLQEKEKRYQDKINRLEQVIGSKEKAIQQKCMIIKFREEAIKRMERKQQEAGQTPEMVNKEIASLKEEITALSIGISHHPDVAKYRLQVESLKDELAGIQKSNVYTTHLEKDGQLQKDLDKLFNEVVTPKIRELEPGVVGTPQRTTEASSVATVERHKTRISKLEAELETLKRERNEERASLQQDLINRDAELVSLRKAVEEYQKIIRSQQNKAQLDKQAMNDMHMETIKTITTPKKAKYELRNRVVLVPASAGGPAKEIPCLDFSGSEEMLTDEMEPEEMREQALDALTQELNQLQEETIHLRAQLDTKEDEILTATQMLSKKEEEMLQVQRLVDEARQQQQQAEQQQQQLEAQLQEAQEQSRLLEGEVHDLKILWEQSSQEGRQEKESHRQATADLRQSLEHMETQLMNKSMEHQNLQKQFEELTVEKETLQGQTDDLQATLSYTEHKLSSAEDSIAQLRKERDALQVDLEQVKFDLAKEKEETKLFLERMKEEGTQKDERIAVFLSDLQKTNKLLEESEMNVVKAHQTIYDKTAMIEQLKADLEQDKRALAKKGDMVAALSRELQSLRGKSDEKDYEIGELKNEIDELNKATCDLQAQLEMQQQELKAVRLTKEETYKILSDKEAENVELMNKVEELEELSEELEDSNMTLQAENHMLKDDKEQLKEEKTDLEKKLEESTVKGTQLDEKVSQLTQELEDQQAKVGNLESLVREYKQHENNQRLEADGQIQQLQEHIGSLLQQLEESRSENQQQAQELRQQLQGKEEHIKRLTGEYDQMLATWLEADTNKKDMENELSQARQEKEQLLKTLVDFEEKVTKQEQTIADQLQAVERADTVAAENTLLKQRIAQMSIQEETLEDMIKEKEDENMALRKEFEELQQNEQRLVELAMRDHEESEKLKSENEILKEQHVKDLQRMEELHSDNSRLAGHQNHMQKISYLDKVREKLVQEEKGHPEPLSYIKCIRDDRRGDTSFRCVLCGRTYMWQCTAMEHVWEHHIPGGGYRCHVPHCNYKTDRRFNFVSHMHSKHKMDVH